MSEEGKLARAMAKSGAANKLSPRGESEKPAPPPPREPDARTPVETSGLRRVQGRCAMPLRSLVVLHDRTGEAASQIRAVRARLLAMNGGKPPRVITVTSGTREEGKSTIALNLAAALSEVDPGRIVVVDGDLRAPGLHLLLNVRADSGLNQVLEDNLDLNGNVYETSMPRLDVVPARAAAGTNGAEGLLAQHCAQLLGKLRQFYSYVIIDTPPVLASSEACTFGKHSDGVILVARLEKTPREVVKRAAEELSHSGARLIGCILTDRKHHVPSFIYRFFGTPPAYYYRYSRRKVKQTDTSTSDAKETEDRTQAQA